MVHETLCDWPLPACMLFTSPFLLFAHVTEDFLLGLESQKPSVFLLLGSTLAVCSAWNPGAHTFSRLLLFLLNVTWAERSPVTAVADMALLLPPCLIGPFGFSSW